MTKNKKLMLGVVVLLAAGWIYAAPYLAVRSMKSAAESGDAMALADHVDFPALKASLKASLAAEMTRQMAREDDAFAALGVAMAGVIINPMIDALVSPEGLAAMMKGRQPDPGRQAGAGAQRGGLGASEADPVLEMGYETFNRFAVRVSDKVDPKRELTMVFLRDGLSWKLSAIRLPGS